jgi:hypothetical protein
MDGKNVANVGGPRKRKNLNNLVLDTVRQTNDSVMNREEAINTGLAKPDLTDDYVGTQTHALVSLWAIILATLADLLES